MTPEQYEEAAASIADAMAKVQNKVRATLPQGRELALVLTKLDEAELWLARSCVVYAEAREARRDRQ